MYYENQKGFKQEVKQDDKDGANQIFPVSLQYLVGTCPEPIFKESCANAVINSKTNSFVKFMNNPACEYIELSFQNFSSEPVSYRLIDLNGKIIKELAELNTNRIIDISTFNDGLIFLELISNKERIIKTFLKLCD